MVAYAGLIAALDALLRGAGAPVLATLLIALAFNPVRVRLQRAVDRLFYGVALRPRPRRVAGRRAARRPTTSPASWPGSARRCGCRSRRCAATGASSPRPAAAGDAAHGAADVPRRPGRRAGRRCPPRRARARRRRPGRARPARRAAGRRAARDRARRGAAGLAGADRRGARGGAPPAAPRPARRARPDAHRRRLQGRRRAQLLAAEPGRARGADRRAARATSARRSTTSGGSCTGCGRPRSTSSGLVGALRRHCDRRCRCAVDVRRAGHAAAAARRGRGGRVPDRHRGPDQRGPARPRRGAVRSRWRWTPRCELSIVDDGTRTGRGSPASG